MSCLHAVPVLMLGARFSNRGLLVGVPIAVVLVIATTLGVDLQYVLDNPESLVIPLTLVLSTAFYTSPLVASDLRHREDSTLDELTGLLNRRAFAPRFAELAQQAALNGQPVSVVAVDIDRFKRVNDEHGHAAGDEVLREVARVFRERLRTFEMLYRMGGDEFLLVLPGADAATASDIADALRRAVERCGPRAWTSPARAASPPPRAARSASSDARARRRGAVRGEAARPRPRRPRRVAPTAAGPAR